ncbi:MAG: Rab family GTPase [Promethearchaeota archaeon]
MSEELIVPGTTIGISLIPGYVEIRDKGLVKKKIPTKHRSFESVLEEVEMFFRVRRKILAPGILRDVLVRIGLPTAKKIVSAQDLETPPAATKTKTPTPKTRHDHVKSAEDKAPKAPSKPPPADEAATFVENPELDEPGVTVLDGEDFTDIADALNAVESMSDSFMAARPKLQAEDATEEEKEEQKEPTKSGLRINITGSEEITAAPTTVASAPMTPEHKEAALPEEETVIEEAEEREVEILQPQVEFSKPEIAEEVESPEAEVPSPAEDYEKELDSELETIPEPPTEDDVEEELSVELEAPSEPEPLHEESEVRTTPAHVVKPLIQSKILILGEAGVGKRSLMRKAELDAVEEDAPGGEPFIHTKVLETENHRVKVQVWSFDEAVKSKISRMEFYDEAEALIVVYAASDRWSFESIDFWLKEATITRDVVPPIVIVANKTDLIKDFEEDLGEQPVTSEEGFSLAEELAKRFGSEEELHPVAFIGTSCLTGEGVIDVFVTSAELAARNRHEE